MEETAWESKNQQTTNKKFERKHKKLVKSINRCTYDAFLTESVEHLNFCSGFQPTKNFNVKKKSSNNPTNLVGLSQPIFLLGGLPPSFANAGSGTHTIQGQQNKVLWFSNGCTTFSNKSGPEKKWTQKRFFSRPKIDPNWQQGFYTWQTRKEDTWHPKLQQNFTYWTWSWCFSSCFCFFLALQCCFLLWKRKSQLVFQKWTMMLSIKKQL